MKGTKGGLSQQVDRDITISLEDGTLVVKRPSEQKRHKALHGLYRSLIQNMVTGVTDGFKIEQELVGVGYRASNQGNVLDLVMGYSHHFVFQIPPEVKVTTETVKGKSPKIILESINKQLLGKEAEKDGK